MQKFNKRSINGAGRKSRSTARPLLVTTVCLTGLFVGAVSCESGSSPSGDGHLAIDEQTDDPAGEQSDGLHSLEMGSEEPQDSAGSRGVGGQDNIAEIVAVQRGGNTAEESGGGPEAGGSENDVPPTTLEPASPADPELEPSTGEQQPEGQVEPGNDSVVRVNDVASLRAALSSAEPGHRIVLAPGSYIAPDHQSVDYAGDQRSAYFHSMHAGTASAPIVLESADPTNKAELIGLHTDDASYVLWIRGEHWDVRNVVLRQGGKGLMLDEASHSHIDGVEVYDVRDEGIHLRSGTSDAIVENCVVDGTGKGKPGFGEGIYVGSDNGQWDSYERACDRNVIRGCTIRDVAAEAIDVKEGTTGTIIEDCTMYGGSISGENFADSFVDLKGDAGRVLSNTFYREGNEIVTRGVAIVERAKGPTATNNWVFGNLYHMSDATGLMVHAYAGSDNYAWDNTRAPEGEDYQGGSPELFITDPR